MHKPLKPLNLNYILSSCIRPTGRRRLGFITGFHSGDFQSISHGRSECYVFTLVFFVGQSQRLVFLPTCVGAKWTVSAFPTSLLPSTLTQHTGTGELKTNFYQC